MVAENWQQLMKFLPPRTNSSIHSIHATTIISNHITKVTKLDYLLKVDIRKVQVLLHNRGWRKLVCSASLGETFCICAFVMYLLLTLCEEDWVSTYTRSANNKWEHSCDIEISAKHDLL